jgi:hypothetical protein
MPRPRRAVERRVHGRVLGRDQAADVPEPVA